MKIIKLIILILSITIYYMNTGNAQGIDFYMQKKAQQYQLNHDILSKQYSELMNLQLVNKINKAEIENIQSQVTEWSKNNFSKYDLSVPQNVETISKYFTSWLNNKFIIEEKNLLMNIQYELTRIKSKEPDTFYKSERYKEISEVLNQLADCKLSDIHAIAWKHGFI